MCRRDVDVQSGICLIFDQEVKVMNIGAVDIAGVASEGQMSRQAGGRRLDIACSVARAEVLSDRSFGVVDIWQEVSTDVGISGYGEFWSVTSSRGWAGRLGPGLSTG